MFTQVHWTPESTQNVLKFHLQIEMVLEANIVKLFTAVSYEFS
jgi:hypothetical protein